jgi:predicted ester cyclase
MNIHKTGVGPTLLGIQTNRLTLSLLLIVVVWIAVHSHAEALDLAAPTQVVNEYLEGLASGDTEKLVQLIDGRMKQNNKQLAINPESYSQFLQTNYAGVQMTLEEIVPDGTGVRAKVRFDYPSQDSMSIEFLLAETGGMWKIIDEEF